MDKQKRGGSATFEQAAQLADCWAELMRDVSRKNGDPHARSSGGAAAQRLIERFDVVHAITEGCFVANALMVYHSVRTRVDCNLSFVDALKQSGAKIPYVGTISDLGNPYIERWFGDESGVFETTLEAVAFTAVPSYYGQKRKMPDVALAEFGLQPASERHTLAFAAACDPALLQGYRIYAWGVVRHGEERDCLTLESREDADGRPTWWVANMGLGGLCSSLSSRHLLLAVRDEKPVE